jgi:capsular polysaccharide biosynthesis protein
MIKKLQDLKHERILHSKDDNGREIKIFKIENAMCVSNELFYPNILFKSIDDIIDPIEERIMSLESNIMSKKITIDKVCKKIETKNFFYFIYNTDNYYHFIYDTLPYLISYFSLKKYIPDIKILMSYPNKKKQEFYKFVDEFLEILKITKDDIILIDKDTIYENIYISSSYTHGIDSNLPPRYEIKKLFSEIVENVRKNNFDKSFPKKIYISRRSWLHNDYTNIGTNYTNRRMLINEDDLVDFLVENGYEEVFTEKLSTVDKILMFFEATHVVGAIGGGLVNVVFSKAKTKLLAIISPEFLNVNYRFKYCLEFVDVNYFNGTEHFEKEYWKKYMRVRCGQIIGEIKEVKKEHLVISYLNENVAGWNSEVDYEEIEVHKDECYKLDNGLNSSFVIDMLKIKNEEL